MATINVLDFHAKNFFVKLHNKKLILRRIGFHWRIFKTKNIFCMSISLSHERFPAFHNFSCNHVKPSALKDGIEFVHQNYKEMIRNWETVSHIVENNPMRLFTIFIIKLGFNWIFMHIKVSWHNNAFYIFWCVYIKCTDNRGKLNEVHSKKYVKNLQESDTFYWNFKLIDLHTINYCLCTIKIFLRLNH